MRLWIFLYFLLFSFSSLAQEKLTTFGIVLKPMVPNQVFRTKNLIEQTQGKYNLQISQKPSFSFGFVLRKSISKLWTIESGLYSTKRSIQIDLINTDSNLTYSSLFKLTSFEIPLQALIYIKLNEKLFMDASTGFTFNFFPSSVGSKTPELDHISAKNGWMQPSSSTSFGFEYRTKKSGYFYVGLSYHFYFFPIYDSKVSSYRNQFSEVFEYRLPGNYSSIDLKYFFFEDKKVK